LEKHLLENLAIEEYNIKIDIKEKRCEGNWIRLVGTDENRGLFLRWINSLSIIKERKCCKHFSDHQFLNKEQALCISFVKNRGLKLQ
jgi:hypothetical protein